MPPSFDGNNGPIRQRRAFLARRLSSGAGEPSLIAGLTRQIMGDYTVDPQRVYVAGLSAGAAAAIMGMTYPDLYATMGVHSGLACGAARDLPSAFAAMRQDGPAVLGATDRRSWGGGTTHRVIPTIVFDGDQDATVPPCNGDLVIAQSKTTTATDLDSTVETGQVPGGHGYNRTLHVDQSGQAILEQWEVHGAGHAWSGGSPAGTYTDPLGPDATREMLRFFQDHARRDAALLVGMRDRSMAEVRPCATAARPVRRVAENFGLSLWRVRPGPQSGGPGFPDYSAAAEPAPSRDETLDVRSKAGSQPVPANRVSAASAMSVFFKPARRSAASADTPSPTASRMRALVTRPR
jgi:poly(3-hydroxybutyrate) depolymerase